MLADNVKKIGLPEYEFLGMHTGDYRISDQRKLDAMIY